VDESFTVSRTGAGMGTSVRDRRGAELNVANERAMVRGDARKPRCRDIAVFYLEVAGSINVVQSEESDRLPVCA